MDDPLFLTMFEARARGSSGSVVVLQEEDMASVPCENSFVACKAASGNWYVNAGEDMGILCRVGYRLLGSRTAQGYVEPTLSVQTCVRENVLQAIHMTLCILAVLMPLPFQNADISNELVRLVRDDKMDLFAWRGAVRRIVHAFVPAADDAVGCDDVDGKRTRYFIERIFREGMFLGCSGVTNLQLTERREGYLRLPQCRGFFAFALQHKVESDFWCAVPEMVEFRDGFVAHLVRVFGALQTGRAVSSLQDAVACIEHGRRARHGEEQYAPPVLSLARDVRAELSGVVCDEDGGAKESTSHQSARCSVCSRCFTGWVFTGRLKLHPQNFYRAWASPLCSNTYTVILCGT